MVVLDGQGAPKAVLKTIELTKRRFDEVDEACSYSSLGREGYGEAAELRATTQKHLSKSERASLLRAL
jgi:uncharacterized protein YhfF